MIDVIFSKIISNLNAALVIKIQFLVHDKNVQCGGIRQDYQGAENVQKNSKLMNKIQSTAK